LSNTENLSSRFYPEQGTDYRSPAQVDRDRVQYSSAFARLAEVTQVVSADRGYVFHNRLTHSLKVAQLARRISEKLRAEQPSEAAALGGPDPDVAEAAALAHDLGHPPFGHIAEVELDKLARDSGLTDGFEGNAQSFRIVSKLAVSDAISADVNKTPVIRGLNMTRATLNAVLKYPWLNGENPAKKSKWGAYDTERDLLQWVRDGISFDRFAKSSEAAIMDWSDDITYAVHDLVDFYCAGQIPLDRLADDNDPAERDSFFAEVFTRCKDLAPRRAELETVFKETLDFFPLDRRYVGTLDQRTGIWQFSTVLISKYVRAIKLATPKPGQQRLVEINQDAEDEIRMLKELTWHYVILNTELATLQHSQTQMIRSVFQTMLTAARANSWKLFPPRPSGRTCGGWGRPPIADTCRGRLRGELDRARNRACVFSSDGQIDQPEVR
jgi:dGTPase